MAGAPRCPARPGRGVPEVLRALRAAIAAARAPEAAARPERMEALTRRAASSAARLAAARRIVVKIGSALLVDAETGRLRLDWLEGLAADVAGAARRGART